MMRNNANRVLTSLSCGTLRSVTGSAVSKAAQAVVYCAGHTFAAGESVYITGVVGMTQINGIRALVTATAGTTITVAINSSAYSTYTSGGIATPQGVWKRPKAKPGVHAR